MRLKETASSWIALTTSVGTLVCCALPFALVTLGFGAAVAGLTAELPWLVDLSRNKDWFFALSALLLAGAGWLSYRPGRSCPADPVLAERCNRLDRWNRRVLWSGGTLWLTGFFFAYLLLPLRLLFE